MNNHSDSLGILMLDIEGTSISASERDLLNHSAVGGLILFARNYDSPGQLKDLVAAVRECNSQLLIAVDQEGGRVQRFREGFLALPPLQIIADAYIASSDPENKLIEICAWAMAAEVLHYGIDISFAPVLDLYSSNSPVIKERAFSAEPDRVIELAGKYIDGMNLAGMSATGKHFPGHGMVDVDSHDALPCDDRSAAEILSNDYRVFAALQGKLGGVMPAHVQYPALDENCAGYSKFWIQDKLRKELAFDGVVFSDDLSMVAAHSVGGATERAELAIAAGCDMILVCNDQPTAIEVADWIEKEGIPANERIGRMRATPAAEIANLYQEDKWETAKQLVNSLTAA